MALNNEYSSDWFRMNRYKIRMCSRGDRHLWRHCPYAHRTERARRRDHNLRYYSSERCQHFLNIGACPDREECEFAHGDFEVYFHPQYYRTQRCPDPNCTKRFCHFAHNDQEDRSDLVHQQQHQRRHHQRLQQRQQQLQQQRHQRFLNQQRSQSAVHNNQQLLNQPRFDYTSVQGSSSAVYNNQQFLNQPRFDDSSVRGSSSAVYNVHQQLLNQPRFDNNYVQGSSSVVYNHHQFLNQPRFDNNYVYGSSSSHNQFQAVEPHFPSMQPNSQTQFGSYFAAPPIQTHGPHVVDHSLQSDGRMPRPRIHPPVGTRPTRTQTTANIGVQHQFLNAQNDITANFPSAVYNQPQHQPQSMIAQWRTDFSRALPRRQADAASLEEARSKRKANYEAGSSNS